MEDKNKPVIRFKGFESKFIEKDLSCEVEFFSGLTYSPLDIVKSNGTFVIRSSNIKDGKLVNADNVYVDSTKVNCDFVKKDDIAVVVRNGSRDLIGKHAQIKQITKNTVIGAFMTGIRSEIPNFINALLDSEQFKIEINKNLGATINQITTGNFKKMKFWFPENKDEQQVIGIFFEYIDKLIAEHQQKHSKLKALKKAMLDKMFPKQGQLVPEIRFKGFENVKEWKLVNGNKLFEPITNKNHNSDLPILAITQNKGAIPRNLIDYNVSVSDKSVESYKVVEIGDFIISLRSFQGGIEYSRYKGLCSPAYIILRKKTDLDDNFYRQYFKLSTYIIDLNRNLEGIRDGKMISYEQFSKILIPFPSFQEQIKIGTYFKNFDELIDNQEIQTTKLQNIKKALLAKMFI